MLLCDIVMLIVTISVVVIGALMALMVGLVLPDYDLTFAGEDVDNKTMDDDNDYLEARSGSNTKLPIYFEARSGARKFINILDYPWAVSVHITRFKDEPWSDRFVSFGVIISRTFVLTGDDCVRFPFVEEDLRRATVKFDSMTWLAGRKIRYVVDYFHMGGNCSHCNIYALKVEHPFPNMSGNRTLHLLEHMTLHKNAMARFLGWGPDEDPREDILKHDALFEEDYYGIHRKDKFGELDWCRDFREHHISWDPSSTPQPCKEESVLKFKICENCSINGRPLVVYDHEYCYLLGMEINKATAQHDTNRKKIFRQFLDLRDEEFLKWILKVTKIELGHPINLTKNDTAENHFMYQSFAGYHKLHQILINSFYTNRNLNDTEI